MLSSPRLLLLAVAVALAAASSAVLLALGLPLLARRALDGERFGLLVLLAALAVLGLGTVLLFRLVARPLERLLGAAARLGAREPDHFPPLGEGGLALSRAAVAFERVAALSLVSMFGYFWYARGTRMDVPEAFLFALSLYLFYEGCEAAGGKARAFLCAGFWLATGAGFLIKGKATFITSGPDFELLKSKFDWLRATLAVTPVTITQTW